MEKKYEFLDSFLNAFPAVMALLVPIFFLPLTTEFFQFNKLALIFVGTAALLIVWAVKMFLTKKVYVVKTPLNFAFFVLTIAMLLSTIFSINKTTSIYGAQGRWFPGLFGFLGLVVFYYALSANLQKTKAISYVIVATIVGGSISSAVALFGYFGIKIGSSAYFQVPNFTLAGSTNITAMVAVLCAVISVTLLMYSKNLPDKIFLLHAFVLNFVTALLIGTTSAWILLFISFVAFVFFVPATKIIKENRTYSSILTGVIIATLIVLALPSSRDLVVNKNYPKEINLSLGDSWVVVSSTLRDFPILGTGPSTFYLNFPRYRPLYLNNTNLWNVRFDVASSEAVSVVGSLGIVGIIAAIYFTFRVLVFILRLKGTDESVGISAVVGAGTLVTLASFVLYPATVLSGFLFFLFLAIATSKSALDEKSKDTEIVFMSMSALSPVSILGSQYEAKVETFQYIVAIPMIAVSLVGMYFGYRVYAADYFMRQSLEAAQVNNGAETYRLQGRALNLNPRKDEYSNTYAQTNLAIAVNLSTRPNLSDEEKTMVQNLVAQSIRSIRLSTEVLNPLNVSGWEIRAGIYRTLIGAAQDADTWSINAYNAAIQLDPTNPQLRLALGGVYFAKEDFLSAGNLFRQAVQLKGDYANAHYNLAQTLVKLQAYADAQREFEMVQRLVPDKSEDYKRVVEDLKILKELPAVAGAQSSQPTVSELENTGSKAVPTEQEPLTVPDETVESSISTTGENLKLGEE